MGAVVSSSAESIRNVNLAEATWPPWLGFLLLYWLPFWACMMAIAFALLSTFLFWYPWLWTAYAFAIAFLYWGRSIYRIDVSPERIAVRRHLRTRIAPMADVLRVDVHRSDWIPRLRGPRHVSTVYVWLSDGRQWRLDLIEPTATDRLLYVLHGYGKPIWIFQPA